MIDAFGAGSFMVATKIKGMIAAEVSDDAWRMTRPEQLKKRSLWTGSCHISEKCR